MGQTDNMNSLSFYRRAFRFFTPFRRVPELSFIPRRVQALYSYASLDYAEVAKHLYLAVQYAVGADVPGDIVEFGSDTARTTSVLAAAIRAMKTDKHLHVFDSFEGLPAVTSPADIDSPHVRSGTWSRGTCHTLTFEQTAKRLRRFLPAHQCTLHAGWFSVTVPTLPLGLHFSVLHVDCDLYQSTLDCLSPLFQRHQIPQGAMLLFDDWNCNRASQDFGERKAWSELVQRHHIIATDPTSYGWAGHRLIIQSYQP